MKITEKQYDYLIQHVDNIMRVNRKLNNNLDREQLACVYHIYVTLLDIRDPSGKKRLRVKKGRDETDSNT